MLVGLCTIVLGDNNNEVLLVTWDWYISAMNGVSTKVHTAPARDSDLGTINLIGRLILPQTDETDRSPTEPSATTEVIPIVRNTYEVPPSLFI